MTELDNRCDQYLLARQTADRPALHERLRCRGTFNHDGAHQFDLSWMMLMSEKVFVGGKDSAVSSDEASPLPKHE